MREKAAVVLELGSTCIRCGFGGESEPRSVLPSPPWLSAKASLGSSELAHAVGEWVARLYADSVQCRPKDRHVVVCESMISPTRVREALGRVLLEHVQVPGVCFVSGPAPALYCSGLATGLILDIGHKEAHALAVYRGVPMQESYRVLPLGLSQVHDSLLTKLQEQEQEQGKGPLSQALKADELRKVLAEMVARGCVVQVDGKPEVKDVTPMFYMLGRGRSAFEVTLSAEARVKSAEALWGDNQDGLTLHGLVQACASACALEVKQVVLGNIIVVGGGAMLPGMCARLGKELQRQGVVVQTTFPRDVMIWVGASIMSSLDALEQEIFTWQDYEKNGRRLMDWLTVA
ncbi:unnamed protein product [Chrysoparadoxa australica]